jgi:hypothetical protein
VLEEDWRVEVEVEVELEVGWVGMDGGADEEEGVEADDMEMLEGVADDEADMVRGGRERVSKGRDLVLREVPSKVGSTGCEGAPGRVA